MRVFKADRITHKGARMTEQQRNVEAAREYIDTIQEWALEHEDFDTSFVDSIAEQLESRGSVTDRQLAALQNIVEKWDM